MSFEFSVRVNAAFLAALLLAFVSGARAEAKSNHINGERSLYLKRGSVQPVNWYPWGREAFNRAAELNVPVLLDVGALWCPWCDLMDRDTYSNIVTAAYINQHFVG